MIFKSVNDLCNKTEQNFFCEQVKIYIRLVEVFCEKNGIEMPQEDSGEVNEELVNIGVIKNEDDLETLI